MRRQQSRPPFPLKNRFLQSCNTVPHPLNSQSYQASIQCLAITGQAYDGFWILSHLISLKHPKKTTKNKTINVVKVGPPLTKLSGYAHELTLRGFEVIKLECSLKLKIKRNDWLIILRLLCSEWYVAVSFVDPSSRCHGLVCSMWLWHFLVILTYLFKDAVNLKVQVVNLNVNDAVLWKFN